MSVFYPALGAFVARNDAPLIGERAAKRGCLQPAFIAATTRRSSANAPQRGGAARWKVAMSAPA
jgi:hypothetical protein